jgi:hypothetical protein
LSAHAAANSREITTANAVMTGPSPGIAWDFMLARHAAMIGRAVLQNHGQMRSGCGHLVGSRPACAKIMTVKTVIVAPAARTGWWSFTAAKAVGCCHGHNAMTQIFLDFSRLPR